MKDEIQVRVLVPRRNGPTQRIEYHVETRTIRLPLRRDDRELLQDRMEEETERAAKRAISG